MQIKPLEAPLKNIAVVRLGAIGDVVQTLPAINQIKHHFPEANIHWIIEDKSYPIVSKQPGLNFIKFPKKQFLSKNPLTILKANLEFRKTLQGLNLDLCLDVQGLFKSGWVCWLSGAKTRLGYDKSNSREFNHWFLNAVLPPIPERVMHRVDFYQKFLSFLGKEIYPMEDPFQLYLSEDEISNIGTIKSRLGLNSEYFLINLGASKQTKRWPAKYYTELIQKLSDKHPDIQFLLVGNGPMDKKDEVLITSSLELKQLVQGVNQTSLRELATLAKFSKFIISGDSLVLHLGSAFKIPSIGLFGGSALPIETKPYWKEYPGLCVEMDCYPCRRYECDHHSCMRQLTVEKVMEEYEKILKNSL
jgi:ADP-heptose:LPS heptosyltransferase